MSEAPGALISEDATAGTEIDLAELISSLSEVHDEPGMLDATMAYLTRFHPREARLYACALDGQGAPAQARLLALWRNGALETEAQEKTLPALQLLRPPFDMLEEQVILDEGSAEGRAPASALLCLREAKRSGRQGLLALAWEGPHAFTPAERAAYRLLSYVLATYLNSLQLQRERGEAMAESQILQEVAKQLNVATSLEEVMRALLLPAPAREEAEIFLGSIDCDPNGKPSWLKILSILSGTGQRLQLEPKARSYLPDIPLAKLCLSNPDTPIVVGDIENDPRVEGYSQKLDAATQVKSTIALALTLQGRWVGLLSISWRRKMALGEREKRIYQGLARQAALLLDNSLMYDRLCDSIKETQHQGTLMHRILEHLPIGVTLIDTITGKPLLTNPCMNRLLGQKVDPASSDRDNVAARYHFVEPGSDRPVPLEELPSRRAAHSLKLERAEFDIKQPDGERINAEAVAVPIVDESGMLKNIIILISDLTARKRAEQERTQLQEEIIRVQAVALAERSSPLIPITNEILVLPLIGALDAERGNQVLDTVLSGTSQRGAKVAIIDITGVPVVDTQAASALSNAAQALRLLGVEAVLTGIRPEVAHTLVSIGVRLDGIITRSTLQSGIQFALKRLNKRAIE